MGLRNNVHIDDGRYAPKVLRQANWNAGFGDGLRLATEDLGERVAFLDRQGTITIEGCSIFICNNKQELNYSDISKSQKSVLKGASFNI